MNPQESEVAEIKWFDYTEAIQTITYENTKTLFKEVLKEFKGWRRNDKERRNI